ncbi:MAG: hypothetical protein ACRCZZ_08990 [Phocaeicola sp.]
MENSDIFWLVAMFVFFIISFFKEAKKKGKNNPAPVLSPLEEEVVVGGEVANESLLEHRERTKVRRNSFGDSTSMRDNAEVAKKTPNKDNARSRSSDGSSAKISDVQLNSRSEAKKAFIYSEIFNRKY